MAITASGLYFLSFEKMFIDTLGETLEAEDNVIVLVTDTHAPAFDTDDFHADLDNEISGGNYSSEALTSTEITVTTGTLKFDAADTVFDNGGSNDVTISNAMAAIFHTTVSGTATDQLIGLWDFVTSASSSASTFTVQWNGSGMFTLDLTP